MTDAAVRLLALFNQLDHATKRVRLNFEDGDSGAKGYLDRMGFFDHLASSIEVLQGRSRVSAARIHSGRNARLVEIARISKDNRDRELPTRLSEVLSQACRDRSDIEELSGAAWMIFAELVDNIYSHSSTPLDGYAALQVYPKSSKLQFAVSDSGLGIMDTLRPSLSSEYPKLATLSDIDLLVEVFRQGLSRHGADRGCGLKGSAAKAMKFKADLDVRMPTNRVLLTPSTGSYKPNMAYCYDRLPLIWGTHICFTISLNG